MKFLKLLKALRLDLHRAFSLLNSGLPKYLRKASIYRSLGWVSDTWRSLIGDTCHSLIGPLKSSLTHARLLVSLLTCARLLVSSLTCAKLFVSSLTRALMCDRFLHGTWQI